MDDEDRFEKTMRLMCRLDDADIDYVKNTAEWIRRCVAEAVCRNPTLSAHGVTPVVLDMSLRSHYRLMRPESVAAQLALPSPPAGG